jgi:hypothetical protein
MSDGLRELARRVALLDDERGDPLVVGDAAADLARFVSVLAEITRSGDGSELPSASPAEADELAGTSRLLRRLLAAAPHITAGPLRLDAQRWIATGKPSHVPAGHRTPSSAHFVGPGAAGRTRPDAKPFGLGMFTSTAAADGRGAWRTYLDLHRGSSLFPLPWHTWAVEIEAGATVREISSAVDWMELVASHPLRAGGLTYPDWVSIGRVHDGVHMTLRAIAATQGIVFPMSGGAVAAPYWDVESTLWLRWRVRSAELVEVTRE